MIFLKKIFLLAAMSVLISGPGKIPSAIVKDLKGSSVNTSDISNNGKPIIIVFWATWCRSSTKELDEIAEVYDDWQKETGVKLVAVSTDDSRSSAKVGSLVGTKGWTYEILLDINQDFKRAMNSNLCPHTVLVDNSGNVVWQQTSYVQGNEEEFFSKIKKLAKGESVSKE